MGPFFKITLPFLLVASALSALAGYAYGVHSSHPVAGPPAQSASPAPRLVGDDVLVPPPSWTRWPPLTDF